MARRLGIYSGTFDPIHPGHVAFAQEARRVCELDEVVFLPERKPRGKQGATDILHRVALIERATGSLDFCRIVHLASDQFTVNVTLPELRAKFGDAHLTFLMGSDVVRTFSYRWDGLDILFRDVSFAIAVRAGDNPDGITGILAEMEQEYQTPIRYTYVRTSSADFTSSQIRNGTVDASRLHPAMADYIREHGLYPGMAAG